jgi:hypothetical protein
MTTASSGQKLMTTNMTTRIPVTEYGASRNEDHNEYMPTLTPTPTRCGFMLTKGEPN